jgi:hypothetical protein
LLQDQNEINGDIMNYITHEASRHFRNKKRECKKELMSLQGTQQNKNIRDLYRGINYFKRGYQPRSNLVKDENSDLLAEFHSI